MQGLILLLYFLRKKNLVHGIEAITKIFFSKACLPGVGSSQNFASVMKQMSVVINFYSPWKHQKTLEVHNSLKLIYY